MTGLRAQNRDVDGWRGRGEVGVALVGAPSSPRMGVNGDSHRHRGTAPVRWSPPCLRAGGCLWFSWLPWTRRRNQTTLRSGS